MLLRQLEFGVYIFKEVWEGLTSLPSRKQGRMSQAFQKTGEVWAHMAHQVTALGGDGRQESVNYRILWNCLSEMLLLSEIIQRHLFVLGVDRVKD